MASNPEREKWAGEDLGKVCSDQGGWTLCLWSLLQKAEDLQDNRFPLASRNLSVRVNSFTDRGMANLTSLLSGIIALRFSLQHEGIKRSDKLQLFVGSLC